MTKLVNFLGRKVGGAPEKPTEETAATAAAAPPAPALPPLKPQSEKADIDLDNELFFPLATQLGQEN